MQSRAADQWTRDLPLTALRGDVTDRSGVKLATSETSYGIYLRPRSVTDPDAVARALSEALSLSYQSVYDKATRKGVSEVTVKRGVTQDAADNLRKQNLNGVYFAQESARNYLYGDFLSQVLGFVSIDNVGQSGIEKYYDKYLKGIDGTALTETDLIGRELENGQMRYVPPVTGLTVTLTIDFTIQAIVENVLDLAMYEHNPVSARAIVLDVNTGEILAMAMKPGLDLNDLPRDNVELLMKNSRNVLLSDVYEPGSTFKILTAAASLEEAAKGNSKAFGADYVFRNNSRTRIIDGSKISCWSNHANGKHANQTLSDALNNSCNPIFTDIALSLGKDTMYKYLDAFGYGKTTGIDFLGEQAGILVPQSSVRNGDLARIGFGQSVAVTALQLAMASAAAVNGGILYKPYLVKEIVDPTTGTVVSRNTPTAAGRAISSSTSNQLRLMLEDVVTNGSGKQAYIEGYRVGGKTGTAQKFVDGALAVGKNVSSFVGFFPASAPKYLALVIVDEPQGQSYGSVVAAPYAGQIFREIINSKNLPPAE